MRLKGAQILAESLVREGVEVIFGYPGGAILPFYHYLPEYPHIKHILVRHEQAAGHAADAYARASGKVGVAVATSGPGATNLVTAIVNAQMDSVPMVVITGQVPRAMIGKDAFQETDVTGITLPITKHNYLVLKAADIPRVIKEAFYIASSGRPGVVLVDIPRDVLQEEAEFHYPESIDLPGYQPTIQGHVAQIRKAAELINRSERPLIIAGHGIILAGAYAELRELAEKAQIPVVNTLLGISNFPANHYLYQGMMGMHGMYHINMATNEADLIIGLGIRFDDRAMGRFGDFAPRAKIIHVDIDPAEIGKNVRCDVPIVGDVKHVLRVLNKYVQPGNHTAWLNWLDEMRRRYPSLYIPDDGRLWSTYVIKTIYDMTPQDACFTTGVGQHQMWAAQYFCRDKPNCFITSGGLGTMGFALPAAIGAKLARPDAVVWAIEGDGGFQMTMYELATCVENRIDVKIAVINNGYLGMVRQWQQLFYNNRYSAVALFNPDYVKLAEAYGIPGFRVSSREEVAPTVETALAYPGPALIEFQVEQEENCFPMVPPGAALSETIPMPVPEVVKSWPR